MATTERETIQSILEAFQEEVGETPHVYFQPPENVKMVYPCFRYTEAGDTGIHADDRPYLHVRQYTVIYITRSADPTLPEAMKNLPQVRFDRRYSANNLNHFVFTFTGMPMWQPSELALEIIAKDFLGGN